jgi:hypothetical protein
MKLNEVQLFIIAQKFRNAIEKTDFSENKVGREANLRMKKFPGESCTHICSILGAYLTTKYKLDPLFEVHAHIDDEKGLFAFHHWLEYDGIIIDITADQFVMVKTPVIVSRDSSFHKQYAKVMGSYYEKFDLNHEQYLISLYDAVVATMKRIDKKQELNIKLFKLLKKVFFLK